MNTDTLPVLGTGRNKFKDLTGIQYHHWKVIRIDHERTIPKKRRWVCKCDCGKFRSILGNELLTNLREPKKRSLAKSCGCKRKPNSRFKDLTGMVFGKRKVLKLSYVEDAVYYWKVECLCGETQITTRQSLQRSQTCRSCFSTYAYGFGATDYLKHPELPKHLYLCCHPERRDEYKIGVAKDPNYRTKPNYGGLILLDSVKSTAKQVLDAESSILKDTLAHAFRPTDGALRDGHTEWRRGEDVVRVWHEYATGLAA